MYVLDVCPVICVFRGVLTVYDLYKKVVGRSHPTPSPVLCYKMFSVWAPPVNDYCVGSEIIKITIRLVIFSL